MYGFVEGAITIGLAGLAAGGLGFVVLIAPLIWDARFGDTHSDELGIVMLAVWLASATVATAWPTLIWLWWPQ